MEINVLKTGRDSLILFDFISNQWQNEQIKCAIQKVNEFVKEKSFGSNLSCNLLCKRKHSKQSVSVQSMFFGDSKICMTCANNTTHTSMYPL